MYLDYRRKTYSQWLQYHGVYFFFFRAAVLYLYKQYLTLIISGHTHFKTGTQADVKAATCVLIAISNGSEPRIKLLTFLLSAVLMPSCAY